MTIKVLGIISCFGESVFGESVIHLSYRLEGSMYPYNSSHFGTKWDHLPHTTIISENNEPKPLNTVDSAKLPHACG